MQESTERDDAPLALWKRIGIYLLVGLAVAVLNEVGWLIAELIVVHGFLQPNWGSFFIVWGAVSSAFGIYGEGALFPQT